MDQQTPSFKFDLSIQHKPKIVLRERPDGVIEVSDEGETKATCQIPKEYEIKRTEPETKETANPN